MTLRFPNPGSDIERMVNSYCIINRESKSANRQSFDLDFMVEKLIDNFQVSSSGAVGQEALKRSTRTDRSRDSLYNQLKMYSEVYRMLGLLRTGSRRLEFSTTVLGDSLCDYTRSNYDLSIGLLRQCFLSITFPNPSTKNLGVARHRPIRWLLMLASELGGTITRDEIIVGVLDIEDDLHANTLEQTSRKINELRGKSRLDIAKTISRIAAAEGVQVNTLQNYTRLPVGLLNSGSIDWGVSSRNDDLYEETVIALALSSRGISDAAWVSKAIDLREENLQHFSAETRAHFANYSHYSMLVRAGLDPSKVNSELEASSKGCKEVLGEFGIQSPVDFLYSPVLETSEEILNLAESIEDN